MDFYLYFIIGMGCVSFFLIMVSQYYENKRINKYKTLETSTEELKPSKEELKTSTEEIKSSTEEVKQPNDKSEGKTIEKTPVVLAALIILSIIGFFLYQGRTTPFRKYYENGNPQVLGYYLDRTGKKHGEWTYYSEWGSLREIEHYQNGKLIKSEKYW